MGLSAAVSTAVAIANANSDWIKVTETIRQATLLITYVWVRRLCGPAHAFDRNFATVVTPEFRTLPQVPDDPNAPPGFVSAINETLDHGGRAISYLQAMSVTVDRIQSAFIAGDAQSLTNQDQALTNFTNAAHDQLAALQVGMQNAAALVRGTSYDISINQADVKTFVDNVVAQGVNALPSDERDVFSLFGIDPAMAIQDLTHVNSAQAPSLLSGAMSLDAQVIGQLVTLYQ